MLEQSRIDSLDVTILRGGGRSVADWAASRASPSPTTRPGARVLRPPLAVLHGGQVRRRGRGRAGLHRGRRGPRAPDDAGRPAVGAAAHPRHRQARRRGRAGRRLPAHRREAPAPGRPRARPSSARSRRRPRSSTTCAATRASAGSPSGRTSRTCSVDVAAGNLDYDLAAPPTPATVPTLHDTGLSAAPTPPSPVPDRTGRRAVGDGRRWSRPSLVLSGARRGCAASPGPEGDFRAGRELGGRRRRRGPAVTVSSASESISAMSWTLTSSSASSPSRRRPSSRSRTGRRRRCARRRSRAPPRCARR